jgi:hypothetical protein
LQRIQSSMQLMHLRQKHAIACTGHCYCLACGCWSRSSHCRHDRLARTLAGRVAIWPLAIIGKL